MDRLNSRLEGIEGRINELKDRTMKIIESEKQKVD